MILSGTGIPGETDTTECLLLRAGGSVSIREPRLEVELEEAYQRLIPHAVDAVKFGARRLVVLSNDTDVLVLLLHYWGLFKCMV